MSTSRKAIKINNKTIEIPEAVCELLKSEHSAKEEQAKAACEFLEKINATRIGYNGLRIDDYYEFIFKIDGEKALDSYPQKYHTEIIVDGKKVRIGTVSEIGLLVIGCKTPYTRSYYELNDLFNYISISFTCKEHQAGKLFFYSKAIVNKILSRGRSYITADDVFKPADPEEEIPDFDYGEPQIDALIDDLIALNNSNHKTTNQEKLYAIISEAYHLDENSRFLSYFKVLDYLSRNQKIEKGESRFSKFLLALNQETKDKLTKSIPEPIEFHEIIECIRKVRNAMIHPAAIMKGNSINYKIGTMTEFQKNLIEEITGFKI